MFIYFTQMNPVIQADRLQSPTKETLNVSVSLGTLILLLHSLAKAQPNFYSLPKTEHTQNEGIGW